MSFALNKRVEVKATYFDVPSQKKWSKEKFPTTWKTQTLQGTIQRSEGSQRWQVKFDYDQSLHIIHESELTLVTILAPDQVVRIGEVTIDGGLHPS
jgi:hypothetical protein